MGYITQEEHDAAVAEEITVTGNSYEMRNYETTYAIDCAVRWLICSVARLVLLIAIPSL